jgi:predicted dehydrogenase
MTQRKYRVGIIGLSGITSGAPLPAGPRAAWQGRKVGLPFDREIIISHAACVALMPNAEVVGYCDLMPDLRDKFKESWGSTWPQATAYDDYKKMLAEADLDILTVGTGDNVHARMVVDGSNAGVKAVFCEKPLAVSMEDANVMVKTCHDNNVPLSVGHTRAWDPLYHKIRDMIRAGEIGPLASIVAIQGGARAMLFRNGTHILHGVTFFADADPTHVSGVLEEGFDDWTEYKGDGGKKPENDPAVSGLIMFENGVRALYECNKKTINGSTLHLQGSKGEIVFGLDQGYATLRSENDEGDDVTQIIKPLGIVGSYQSMGYVAAYEELISLIEAGGTGESVGSGREARRVVQVMNGFLKSHQAGSSLVEVPQ